MIGIYKKGKVIGQGSFGTVYLSTDPITKEEVALKIISKKSQTELLTKVKHENVVLLRSFQETQSQIIIVMDYGGKDLEELLKLDKKLPISKIKMYSHQILSAMLYLHQNRILHRDLKPQNILLKGNHIKICDFGFAKKMSASTNFVQSIKGTPLYIAPEILNEKSYNHKVDIWSFGIIIYQLFVGATPFFAESVVKLRPKILFDRVNFPNNMPAQLRDLIDGMLQKDPQKRYDWDQVKNHAFFKDSQVKEEANKMVIEELNDFDIESKVLVRLDVDAECKEILRIQSEIATEKINPRDLKVNVCFYMKLTSIISEAILNRSKISNEVLLKTFKIITTLIIKVDLEPEHKDDDITKNSNLIAGMLKLALQQTNLDMLNSEIVLIGYLLKNNFDGIKIDFEIDDDVTLLVAETLKKSSIENSCFTNSLKLLGILTNQAITTISHSQQFFTRVLEDKLLTSICDVYFPTIAHAIILELLEKFIHPSFQPVASLTGKCKQTFLELKKEVAKGIGKRGFIQANPLILYGLSQKNSADRSYQLEYHMNVLYECVTVSKEIREAFLKQKFWSSLSTFRSSRLQFLSISYQILHLDSVSILSKQTVLQIVNHPTPNDNKLVNVYLAYFIADNMGKRSWGRAKIEAMKGLMSQIKDLLAVEEAIKTKGCKEVLGFFNNGGKYFDEILIGVVHNFVKNPPTFADEDFFSIIRPITDQILKLKSFSELSLLHILQILQVSPGQAFTKQNQHLKAFESIFIDMINKGEWAWLSGLHGKQFVVNLLSKLMQVSIFKLNMEDGNTVLLNVIEQHQFYRFVLGEEGYLNQHLLQYLLHYFNRLTNRCKTPALFDFIAVTGLQKIKPFFRTNSIDLTVEIINTISYLARTRKQNYKFLNQAGVIAESSRWLNEGAQQIREKTLHLIGNLAKHSNQNFDAFQKWKIIPAIEKTLSQYRSNKKILKNAIYAIGNISFYNERFVYEIKPMIKYLMDGLSSSEDSHFVINTISTISNLLRHSPAYLSLLIQTGITRKIMEIILRTEKDKDMLTYSLNVLKKQMAFSQFWKAHSKDQIKQIYQKKRGIVKDDNDCMRKIKEYISN